MTGTMIIEKYEKQNAIDGLRRFYSQNNWKHLLNHFETAVEFTKK